MHSCQGLQEDHTQANLLDLIKDAEPEPQTSGDDGTRRQAPCPREIVADVGRSPPRLCPTRGAQAETEDGEDPAVLLGQCAEGKENEHPNDDKEADYEDDNLPRLGVLGGPEERPVAPERGGEEPVLHDNHEKEPEDDATAEERRIEEEDPTGCLAVVFGQAQGEDHADSEA